MIAKTLSGICFLDELYGGVYAGRSFLVSGRTGTGKSTLGFQFVRQGLQQDERCLILSTMAANDMSILAEALGFAFGMPVNEGNLVMLEYQSFIPGKGISEWGTLPPEGFGQLKEIIEANSVKRVVLDTALPWIAMPGQDRLAEHIFSFVRSCDRLGVTTMMTIPKPVSSMAFRLKKAMEDVLPISILLNTTAEEDRFTWQAVKYLGEKKPSGMAYYTIVPEKGFVPFGSGKSSAPSSPSSSPPSAAEPLHDSRTFPAKPQSLNGPTLSGAAGPPSRSAKAPAPAAGEEAPVRFSSVVRARPTEPSHPESSPSHLPLSDPDQPARLASVWSPDHNKPS